MQKVYLLMPIGAFVRADGWWLNFSNRICSIRGRSKVRRLREPNFPGRVYDPYSERTLRQALTLRRSASSAKPSPTFCSVAKICIPLRR